MTSRRRITPNQTVSLFPFLAVLICTMGALLVLLVIMARQARVRAAAEASASLAGVADKHTPASENPQPELPTHPAPTDGNTMSGGLPVDPEQELALLQYQGNRLETMHRENQTRLNAAQFQLGHIENQSRQMHDRLAGMYRDAATMQNLDTSYVLDRDQAHKEFALLQELIRESEEEIEKIRRDTAKQPKHYAIIPYQGSNGTHRRPIYIECRQGSVVLLPEGIELTPDDFSGPIGPGHPLAAALRAAQEYYTASLDDPTAMEARPYPLLVVRSEGILAYYQAREAIASWGPDFGYELIDGDWPLQLPAADPQLAQLEYRAVEAARLRQRELALAAPRRFGASWRRGAGRPPDSLDTNPPNSFVQPGFDRESGATDDPENLKAAGTPITADPGMPPDSSRGAEPNAGDVTRSDISGEKPADPQSPVERGDDLRDPGDSKEDRLLKTTADCREGTPQESPNQTTAGAVGGSPLGTAAKGSPEFGVSGLSIAKRGNAPPGIGGNGNAQPLDAVPIRRAIHVVVNGSQLAILPEQGADGSHVVPIADSFEESLNEFVLALQERMRSWGIAGHGLFWKPIIILKPSPAGAEHAERFARRLRGSGLEIRIPGSLRQ
ncbi:MAG: hypothetical protein JW829_15735 [Pirellulales bacterium]|nr:hypothetical protein [Pirellulales bacterium]